MVTATDRAALTFSLSGGEKNDSPEGIKLLNFTSLFEENKFLLMDRAYQGDNMRLIAQNLGYEPSLQKATDFISRIMTENFTNAEMKLNDFFRRTERFRRIFTRYEKLDILYSGFILFAMIVDSLV